MDLDDVGIAFGLAVVQMLGQVPLGQDLAGVQHEIAQQAEFGGGQVDVGAVQAHALALLVQAQPGGLQLALVGQPMGAAQQGLDAQGQLFRMERLGQVVVGTGLEPIDAFGPGTARGEDQHRSRESQPTPLLEYLQAGTPGQAEVEDDQVVGFAGALHRRVAAVGQPVHRVALAGQAGHQFVGQGNVILNQQQPHQSSSSSFRMRPLRASSSSSRTTPSRVSSSTS